MTWNGGCCSSLEEDKGRMKARATWRKRPVRVIMRGLRSWWVTKLMTFGAHSMCPPCPSLFTLNVRVMVLGRGTSNYFCDWFNFSPCKLPHERVIIFVKELDLHFFCFWPFKLYSMHFNFSNKATNLIFKRGKRLLCLFNHRKFKVRHQGSGTEI